MIPIVFDTSVVLYWTLQPERLTTACRQALDGSHRVLISAISIWEIAVKASRGKLTLPFSMDDYVAKLKRVRSVEIVPVDDAIFLRNVALVWDNRDPADRTIVATALARDCVLATSDRVIADFYPRCIW